MRAGESRAGGYRVCGCPNILASKIRSERAELKVNAIASILLVFAAAITPARPGWLGLGLTPHRSGNESWVTVQVIAPGGPAERAGLHVGDVVTHIDDQPFRFRTDLEMLERLAKIHPRKRVQIQAERVQQKMTFSVIAGRMSDDAYERWLGNLEYARAAAGVKPVW